MLTRFLNTFPKKLLACALVLFLFPLTAFQALGEGTDILLTFTGDCTLGSEDRLKDKSYSIQRYIRDFGYGYPFLNMKDLFTRDDLTVINLENVFSDSMTDRAKKTYNFRSPRAFARILPEGGVELAFLGNNHIMDYGVRGLNDTLAALEGAGVAWFADTKEASAYYILEKNGVKVGFTGAYTSYWHANPEGLDQTFLKLKELGCDAIVGVMHGGAEYSPVRNYAQQRMAEFMAAQGAAVVIGHHPHVVQGLEIIGQTSVVYSLGNFSFGGNRELRATKALVAQVTLRFSENKTYLGHQLNLIPVCPSGTLEFNDYQPAFLGGEDASQTIALVQRDSDFTLSPYVEGLGALQPFVPAGAPEAMQ